MRSTVGAGRERLLLVFVGVVPLLPALVLADAFTGDAQVHWKWQYHFSRAFWAGDLLPRWLVDLNSGFGSPALFYYAPLTQWLTSLWAPLLPAPADIPARFVLTLALFSIVGAFGARAWIAALTDDRRVALAGAILYTLLPYHAYANVFQRGAFAELAAMAWMPWTFLGAIRAIRGERVSGLFVAALALLFVSHAPSVLMIVPALGVFILHAAWRARSLRAVLACAGSGVLAALMAAFYLVPAFMLGDAMNVSALFGAYFAPTAWLMFGPAWPNWGTSLYTHALFALYATGGIVAAWAVRGAPLRGTAMRALAALAGAMLLMTVLAAPFWAHVALAAKIQFPWRLLTLATLFLALAGGIGLAAVGDRLGRRGFPILLAVVAGGLLVLNGGFVAARLLRAEREGRAPPGIAATLDDRRDQGEYRVGDLAAAERLFGDARLLPRPAGPPPAVDRWASRDIALSTDFARPTDLLVRQFRYTGWSASIDGAPPRPTAAGPAGVVAVRVPAGPHRVALTLPPTRYETWGWRLSALGLVLALGLTLLRLRSGRRPA